MEQKLYRQGKLLKIMAGPNGTNRPGERETELIQELSRIRKIENYKERRAAVTGRSAA
jgi:hypothetical protein